MLQGRGPKRDRHAKVHPAVDLDWAQDCVLCWINGRGLRFTCRVGFGLGMNKNLRLIPQALQGFDSEPDFLTPNATDRF